MSEREVLSRLNDTDYLNAIANRLDQSDVPTMPKVTSYLRSLATRLKAARSLLGEHPEKEQFEKWICNACKTVYSSEAEAAGCPCPMHSHARTKL